MKWCQEGSSNRTALCSSDLRSPLSPTRERYVIVKKHKLHYEPNNFQLRWPHRPLKKLWADAHPKVWWPDLPLHHGTSVLPVTGMGWTASPPASQPPEQLLEPHFQNPLPASHPERRWQGMRQMNCSGDTEGCFVLSIDTALFVILFFATEVRRAQGVGREQPSKSSLV